MKASNAVSITALGIAILALAVHFLPESPLQESSPGTRWKQLTTFSGSTSTDTTSFHVSSLRWRVEWNATFQFDSLLRIKVFPAGYSSNENLVEELAYAPWEPTTHMGEAEIIGIGEGDFYLQVTSKNCTWQINVEGWS